MADPSLPDSRPQLSGATDLAQTLREGETKYRGLYEQASEALRASEQRHRAFFESGIVGVIYWNVDGAVTGANDKFLQMVGYGREDLAAGRIDLSTMTPPEYRALDQRALDQLLATGVDTPHEKEYIRKDGTRVPIIVGAAMLDKSRRDGVAFVLDVTDRRRAAEARRSGEAAVRRERVFLRTVIDSLSSIVTVKDADGHYLLANRAAATFHGIAVKEFEGKSAEQVPNIPAGVVEQDREVMRTGKEMTFEVEASGADGVLHSFINTKTPLLNAGGACEGILTTAVDITWRKRAERTLTEMNARLAEADRRKDEFIAILSHELRNPLAPIRYALPLLQSERLTPSGSRAVAVIDRQLDHLSRLVDDLLDVSRITRGVIELHPEWVTLGSIVTAATEAASPSIIAARHTLKIVVPDDPIWLHADSARLAQVVTNLLNNSAKYTPRGGEITVEGRREHGQAIICVHDNGMGIPVEALPTIFDMFRQVNRPDKSQGGLGIGLALVKRLVEMHGGTIEAFSEGVDRGARFLVRLPVAAEPRCDESAGAAGGPERHARRLKVLIVDDNADLVDMLAALVSNLGHGVRKALDGRSAVSAAIAYRPDIVFLDLGLPVLGGIEVARELKRRPETAGAVLVALTGWGQAEQRSQTEEAGFAHHLTKPTDPKKLERLLAEFAGRAGRQV